MRQIILLAFILLIAVNGFAQNGRLSGRVVDPSGAVVGGADITLLGPGNTKAASAKSNPDGSFTITAPSSSSYALQVVAAGFDPSVQGVSSNNSNMPITVTLSVAKITQQVEVNDNPNAVSLDQASNRTALVLKEDEIQALPDDVDELTQYLTDLAGPRAAAAGGVQFMIDGFLGGQLPPKDQIKEIRINTNPFTTEFTNAGFGRIEIITKPGTGAMHGNFNFNLRNDAMNATPFNALAKVPYTRESYQATVAGPFIHNKLTMTLAAQRLDAFNTTIIRALTPSGSVNQNVTQPNLRDNFNIRGQYGVTENNIFNFNLELQGVSRSNQGIGSYNLSDNGYSAGTHLWGLHFRDTAVLSSRFVHETRFEVTNNHNTTTPDSQISTIVVLDAFTSGGAQNKSDTSAKSFLFGDTLLYNSRGLTVKTGIETNYYRNHAFNQNNFAGTYTFSSLSNYLQGTPTTFTLTQGNPLLAVSQVESAAFVQTDIKLSDKALISPGMRYQIQTHLKDYNNFDPRVSMSYQLNKTTVIRLGAGTFHQTFGIQNYLQLQQLNGANQKQIVITNPSYPNPFTTGTAQTLPVTVRTVSPDLVSSYTSNLSGSIEKQVKRGTISVAYDFMRGSHVYRSRNTNAPVEPGFLVRPDPTQGNIYQLESTGLSTFKGLTFGFRGQITNTITLFSNYTLSYSSNDTDGAFSLPANNYDLASEWGRAGNDSRNRLFTGLNGRLPGNMNFTGVTRVFSGRPYNITTGFDNFNDGQTNSRPVGVARNSAQGPGQWDIGGNISKTIALFKHQTDNGGFPGGFPGGGFPGGGGGGGGGFPGGGPGGGGPPPGGGPGGPGGPGGGGSFGGGRPPGGPGFPGGPNIVPTATATFFVNLQNVLNHRNFNNPSGVLTSPFFGQATSAQAPRTVEVGVRVNF
jgi:Carboxypeptidase regulatory-like domain